MKSPAVLALGALLLLCGILVPSATWIQALRGLEPAQTPDTLLHGAALFRTGLSLLGLLALAGGWLGWWTEDERTQRTERPPLDLALVALLVFALCLRAWQLNAGLWLDEILTLVNYVRLPFGEVLTRFEDQNQHFLFSVLANRTVALLGEQPWTLRLPAMLFGVGGIWALYLLAREVVPRGEALLAAGLLCASYHHVWFSQNARGYSGVLFFALLSSALLLRGFEDGRPRTWLAYGFSVALGGYTHLTMIFVAAVQFALYVAWALRERERPAPVLWQPLVSGVGVAGLLAITLYGFGLPGFIEIERAASHVEGIPTWQNPLWALREALRSFQLDLGLGTLVGLAGLCVVGIGSASYMRRRPAIVALFFGPAVLIFVVGVGIGHHLWPRTFFLLAGFAVLILVRGGLASGELIARALRRPEFGQRIGVAGVLCVTALSLASVTLAYGPKQDFAGARDRVEARRGPDDAVVTVGIAIFPYAQIFAPHWQSAEDAEGLRAIRDAHAHTWVVNIFPPYLADRHGDLVAMLEADFELIDTFEGTLGGGAVYVYRTRAASSGSAR